MSERALVDWRAAQRVAEATAARRPRAADRGDARSHFSAAALEEACAEGLQAVSEYTLLEPVGPTPLPESLERAEWAQVALRALADATRPLEARVGRDLDLPGPFGPIARVSLAALAGAEAGLVVGYVASRVLGQYEFALFGPERPARLLFVPENLAVARAELGADPDLFLRWVALHETTHVVQFEGVGWLAAHVRGLAAELIESAARNFDACSISGSLARLLCSDPRRLFSALLDAELVRLLADPAQRERLDRLQATMAAIEGHAEHVMDACAASLHPSLAELRRRLDARRATRAGLGAVLARLLGFELKLRQYAQGRAFFDAIEREGGPPAVRLVWNSAAHLPTAAELERPIAWCDRVAAGGPASP